MNYRSRALELVDQGFNADDMLVACLQYMSQDEVKDMMEMNEYPLEIEDEYEPV